MFSLEIRKLQTAANQNHDKMNERKQMHTHENIIHIYMNERKLSVIAKFYNIFVVHLGGIEIFVWIIWNEPKILGFFFE